MPEARLLRVAAEVEEQTQAAAVDIKNRTTIEFPYLTIRNTRM